MVDPDGGRSVPLRYREGGCWMAKKAYEPHRTRTFALVGHRSSGKTTLADSLLAATGVTRERHSVDEGTSLLDHDASERRRQMSIQPSFAWMEWSEHLLNLIDTPGSAGLRHEAALALSGADGCFVVVSGPDGVEVGAEDALGLARAAGVPCAVVINKMDRRVDVEEVLERLEAITGARPVPMQVPFNDDDGRFCGVASLLMKRALRYDPEGSARYSVEPLPDELSGKVAAAWEYLVESVALADDALLERYLEFLELPLDAVRAGLAAGMASGALLPVLFTAGGRSVGVHALLDFSVWAFPDPLSRERAGEQEPSTDGPLSARLIATQLDGQGQPFHVLRILSGTPGRSKDLHEAGGSGTARLRKLYQVRGPRRTLAVNLGPGSIVATWDPISGRPGTLWAEGVENTLPAPLLSMPMVSWLLEPVQGTTPERLDSALKQLEQLDAGVELGRDPFTGHPVIGGHDGLHLEVVLERLRTRLGVDVSSSLPPVQYVEAPAISVSNAHGVHRKGGDIDVMEFGECWVNLEPTAPDSGNTFNAQTSEERLPSRFIPAVEDGVQCGLMHGPTAGYPVIGADVLCTDGEYDMFASTDEHLKFAGTAAVRKALVLSGSRLMEPWSDLAVQVPTTGVGDILQHLAAHRGQITGMEVEGDVAHIQAMFPERELQHFAPRLQSLTSGRGRFTRGSKHYRFLPDAFVKEAIAASPFRNQAPRPEPVASKPDHEGADPEPDPDGPTVRGVKP